MFSKMKEKLMKVISTNIYNQLRLKRKGFNSIEITLPLDILRNPNYRFDEWQEGALIRFHIIDKNKIMLEQVNRTVHIIYKK